MAFFFLLHDKVYGSDSVLVFTNKLLIISKSGTVLLVWLLTIENIESWKN